MYQINFNTLLLSRTKSFVKNHFFFKVEESLVLKNFRDKWKHFTAFASMLPLFAFLFGCYKIFFIEIEYKSVKF